MRPPTRSRSREEPVPRWLYDAMWEAVGKAFAHLDWFLRTGQLDIATLNSEFEGLEAEEERLNAELERSISARQTKKDPCGGEVHRIASSPPHGSTGDQENQLY